MTPISIKSSEKILTLTLLIDFGACLKSQTVLEHLFTFLSFIVQTNFQFYPYRNDAMTVDAI